MAFVLMQALAKFIIIGKVKTPTDTKHRRIEIWSPHIKSILKVLNIDIDPAFQAVSPALPVAIVCQHLRNAANELKRKKKQVSANQL